MSGALFSSCRTWRYLLTREIPDPELGCSLESIGGTLTVIGLNPSTADEKNDDPTIRRCIGFARRWGFERLQMVNLYAYRATDPRDLWLVLDPVGPENDQALADAFANSDRILAAWGAHARADRLERFAELFAGETLWTLGLTKSGAPRHPLYVRGDVVPVPYLNSEVGGALR